MKIFNRDLKDFEKLPMRHAQKPEHDSVPDDYDLISYIMDFCNAEDGNGKNIWESRPRRGCLNVKTGGDCPFKGGCGGKYMEEYSRDELIEQYEIIKNYIEENPNWKGDLNEDV